MMSRMWQAKSSNEPKYNPLSPASDNYCEKIYKTLQDGHGVFQERVIKLCEVLDIDVRDLAAK